MNDYYLDTDSDGLGAGESSEFCSAFVPSGWVLNGNDVDDDCTSNIHDECNVCDGDNSSCSDCAGTPNGSALVDECGDCDTDISNDCVQDCAGVWGGTSVDEKCGICVGDDT